MDEERFLHSSRVVNPRNLLGGFTTTSATNGATKQPMPNDPAAKQQTSTPIVDRFKSMLKGREDDSEEIVRLYELVLSELTFNSKPIITDLTIIAGEQREHGEGIADAICARIIEVPVEQKLPSLYLLDSIVKNIGREYVRYFSARLPEVFCEAYRQVNPNMHPSMRHLFGTWSAVFPSSVLHKIEVLLQFSTSQNRQSSGLTSLRNSESPRPTHGIHVNPKYLEARRQFESSTADSDFQDVREISSSVKTYGKPSSIGLDGYDTDKADLIPSQSGAQRLNSTGPAGRSSFTLNTEKLPQSSAHRTVRCSSPFGIDHTRSLSSAVDEFVMDDSPSRVVERASPSHSGFGGRGMGINEEVSDWRRVHISKDTHQRFEDSAGYGFRNEVELQNPRALIYAYGTDQGSRKMNHKHQKVENLDINGIGSNSSSRTWQNTEEEEFVWENMSPTLIDRGLNNDLFRSSTPPPGSIRSDAGFETHRSAFLETDFRRGKWSNQPQIPLVNGSSAALDDAVPSIGSGRVLINKIRGFRSEEIQFPGSRYPQEGWNLPQNLPRSSQHHINAKEIGRNFQAPLPLKSAGEQRASLVDGFSDADGQIHGSSAVAPRMSFTSLDSFNSEIPSATGRASTGAGPSVNMPKYHPLPLLPTHPLQNQIRNQFDVMSGSGGIIDQGLNKSFLGQQQFDSESKTPGHLPRFPNHQAGPSSLTQRAQGPTNMLPPHLLRNQDIRQNFPAVSTPFHIPPFNHGYIPQGHGGLVAPPFNPIPGMPSSMPILNIPNTSLPPLPPGPPPDSSHMIPMAQNPGTVAPRPPAGGALSGLISSLVAQGLISFTNQASQEDSVGLEFNSDLLKVRHESAITALYTDLPRQCTTCGLRFKCQEEHSSHMDWHVTKNRMSKNRKQKPSRKWFVNESMWLRGAEALGTDAVPGFLPTENVAENIDEEETAVPADEDQNVCALCGEPFDDFYSDETEEWMYKGAVYMNAPTGSIAGMDRSQLGPIVHAKCRSESSTVPPEDFSNNEGGLNEEGSQRKRMRS